MVAYIHFGGLLGGVKKNKTPVNQAFLISDRPTNSKPFLRGGGFLGQ